MREGTGGHPVGTGRVAVDFFDAFDVPIVAGRTFHAGDMTADATAVVANRSFVQNILRGANALGRRVRYVGRGGDLDPGEVEMRPWYEIVGVVEDFPNRVDPGVAAAKVYHPSARVWPMG